jgi:hypothetical protein
MDADAPLMIDLRRTRLFLGVDDFCVPYKIIFCGCKVFLLVHYISAPFIMTLWRWSLMSAVNHFAARLIMLLRRCLLLAAVVRRFRVKLSDVEGICRVCGRNGGTRRARQGCGASTMTCLRLSRAARAGP